MVSFRGWLSTSARCSLLAIIALTVSLDVASRVSRWRVILVWGNGDYLAVQGLSGVTIVTDGHAPERLQPGVDLLITRRSVVDLPFEGLFEIHATPQEPIQERGEITRLMIMARFIWMPPVVLAFLLWEKRARVACRMWIRRRYGRCHECGYDLTGNVSGKCPECGHSLSP